MKSFSTDLRFGWRMLSKYPGFSLLAVLAVALGINLVTCQLVVIDAFLFRHLPVPNGHQIFHLTRTGHESDKFFREFHPDELAKLTAQQTSFSSIGGYYEGTVNLSDGANPRRFHGAFVTWNFLEALQLEAEAGRGFLPEEDNPAHPTVAVMLSYEKWLKDFGGDPAVIGRAYQVNARAGRIVGVMPPGIQFPRRAEVWVPFHAIPKTADGEEFYAQGFGRLRADVDPESAREELSKIGEGLAAATPEHWKHFRGVEITPFHRAFLEHDAAGAVPTLWIMLLAVLLVLLIACANVANLLLARSTVRGRELAVRAAIGATRGRLIAQMLGESFVLCLLGGALGVVSTVWTIGELSRRLDATLLPFWVKLDGFNPGVLLAVFGITIGCALVAGLVPAIKASRADILELLKESGRTSTNLHIGWFGRALVTVQVAMSFALLILAGLMIKTITELRRVDVPYDPAQILSARFGLFEAEFPGRAEKLAFLDSLVAELRREPWVHGAAITTRAQFKPALRLPLTFPGRPAAPGGERPMSFVETISSTYFLTLGVSLTSGRNFNAIDVREDRPVAIVNESFAARHFPDRNPVGQTIAIEEKDVREYTIVGVAPDLRMNGVGPVAREQHGVYVPLNASRERFFTVVLRFDGAAGQRARPMREAVLRVNPNLPLYWLTTYNDAIDADLAGVSIVTTTFLIFGGAAVLLASIGIYGVVSFTVSQRTPEIGIRLALGARQNDVVRMIVRQGAAQLCSGLLVGTLLAVLLGGLLRRFVPGIGGHDLILFVLVGVVISAVALLSSLLPAQKAVRLKPLAALRHD